jgi:hypothetical protein
VVYDFRVYSDYVARGQTPPAGCVGQLDESVMVGSTWNVAALKRRCDAAGIYAMDRYRCDQLCVNCVTRRFPTDTRAVLVEVAPVGIFYQVVRNGFGTSGKRSTNNRGHSLEERTHFYLIIWLVFRLVLATLGSTPLSSSLTLKDNASTNILGESAENDRLRRRL